MKNLNKLALTKLVGGAVVLLILVVGYLLVLSPRMSKVDEIKAQTESTAQNNQAVATTIADLEDKKAGLDAQRRIAKALARRFPTTAVQADMFADIRDAAAQAGIKDENVTALTPTVPVTADSLAANGGATLPQAGVPAGTGMATSQVSATVTGTRQQLQTFLAAMEGQSRSYLFDTAGLSPAGETDGAPSSNYTLALTGSMFLLPAVVDPDAPPPAATTEAPADTTTAP
ncbi:hypothetical protein [Nocardioides rubriscoriae]|uniref:hypothetical protein n=1 Tax=Nocardioides rubriscoriae TaxID=642762 RepID=UPI0011DFF339|nr:hypothetical protein [Nocardioides rubriscoriae]